MALFQKKQQTVTITKMNRLPSERPYDKVDTEPVFLESLQQKRERRRSHWVIYVNTLVMAIGFSIIMTGAWPYLQQIAPDSSKEFLGWIIAVNPLGQLISSPILGIWANKAGSIRGAFIATILLYIIGNVIYATLVLFGSYGKIMMIVSRFIIGLSSGNVTLCRSYVASSSTLRERTTAVSIIAGAMSIGVIIGPSIQSALAMAFDEKDNAEVKHLLLNSTIGDKEVQDTYYLDVYNTTGWVSVVLGVINLLLFMPCIFKEFNIESHRSKLEKENNIVYPKPDYTAVFSLLIPFFFIFFVNVLIETILVPLCIDMYAWEPVTAVKYVGIGLSIAAFLTLVLFALSGTITKKLKSDRKAVFFLGVIPITVGLFIFIPMGSTLPQIQNCTSAIAATNHTNGNNIILDDINLNTTHRHKRHIEDDTLVCESYGCPPEQTWCFDTPIIELPQLLIASLFIVFGYPFIFGITGSIYSKMLGPKPQGLWMGLLTSTGSLSRMTGPLFVSYMYSDLGPQWTFGALFCMSVCVLALTACFYKRFTPLKPYSNKEQLEQLQPKE